MKDQNSAAKDWTTLVTTLGNRISSGNRTEEVDMSMWDTLFPLAKEESCGTHVARYLATYRGDKYELFTDIKGTPLCIHKIIERITLNKKARQIEWDNLRGIVGGYRRYCIWDCPVGIKLPGERLVVDTNLVTSPEANITLTGTIYKSTEDAKQACQDHLQAYVDGLYLQLQELTEDL